MTSADGARDASGVTKTKEDAQLTVALTAAQARARDIQKRAEELLCEAVTRTAWLNRFVEAVEGLDRKARQVPSDEWARRLKAILQKAHQPASHVTREDLRQAGLERFSQLLGSPSREMTAAQLLDVALQAYLDELEPELKADLVMLDLDECQEEEALQ